ncbi:MAG: PhnB protein [Acidobacteriota bacterium]|jgi:uncharacterized glyoxalase superfamily protein PhnB
MAGAVKPVPDGYHTITPYFTVANAAAFLDFLTKMFGAEETERMVGADGTIRHAEMRIGDSAVMVGQAPEQSRIRTNALYVYVPDVDETYQRGLEAGSRSIQEPTTHFYGDRSGGIEDPHGNTWWIATHLEDVPVDEMKRRAASQRQP